LKTDVKEDEVKTVMDFTGTQCGDGKWNTIWTYEVEHNVGMLHGTHSGILSRTQCGGSI
jgi:hypothetical protein